VRTSLGRHERGKLPAVRASDAKHAMVAASLQKTCPSWLVMWSPWHQTYTGFACFTSEPVIIDEAKADAFLARIKEVELASNVGRAA
jgi:hypothetical protein